MAERGGETSSSLIELEGSSWLMGETLWGLGNFPLADALTLAGARLLRVVVPFAAAVMVAWREVRSRIILSFTSCLSAWTVWACCRRLSSLEKCLPQ
jgi:hypothetical protein